MTYWLAQHPQVFIPEVKVPFHFGMDLDMVPKRRYRSLGAYLSLFSPATGEKRLGESTVFYLCSERAAQEIKEFNPSARIIIMLRNPVDMMYSMHARNLMDGNEDIREFKEALDAEPERKEGRRVPKGSFFRQGLYYRQLANFPAQVKRYQDCFGKEKIHIIIFDDLIENKEKVFKNVTTFLDVDSNVNINFHQFNKSVTTKSIYLTYFLSNPPAYFRALPNILREGIAWRLEKWNNSGAPRGPMDGNLRRQLLCEFEEDIVRLGDLVQRDLTGWLGKRTTG